MNPLVSVIVPVYNVKDYLCECLDSIVGQTYQNIEVIVVDDGSFDGSEFICDKYAALHNNIMVIHKFNGGLSNARNIGILHSSGQYIYFLDSDDFIELNAIEMLVSATTENKADLVFFDAECFQGNGEYIKQTYTRVNHYSIDSGYQVEKQLIRNSEFKSAVYLYLVDKGIVTTNDLSFIDGIVYEDMDFTFKVFFYANNVLFLHEKLHHRRFRQGSIMTSVKGNHNFLSAYTSYLALIDFVTKEKINTDKDVNKFLSRNAHSVLSCYETLSPLDKTNNREKLDFIKDTIQNNSYHYDSALKGRCHGKVQWFFGRIKKKTARCKNG